VMPSPSSSIAQSLRLALTALAAVCSALAQPGLYTQYAYVSNHTGSVSVINGTTGALVGSTIPLTGAPAGLALVGGQLYIAQSSAASVAVLDTASNVVAPTSIAVGSTPVRLAVTPNGQAIYVANNGSNTVSVISTASNTVVATITVGTGPTSLAVSPSGSRVFVANPTSGTVSVIATSSNTVTHTWTFSAGVNGVAVGPNGGKLYVSNATTNTITICNATSGSTIATITGLHYPDSMAITPDGSYLYVSNRATGTVSVIDTSSQTIVATVSVGAAPICVSISWDGSQVYVANYSGNSLSVISTATNSVVSTITATMASPYSVVVTNLCSPAPTGFPALTGTSPSLPQACYMPRYPVPTSTTTATSLADLQAKVDSAVCGENIIVPAGSYSGDLVIHGPPSSGTVNTAAGFSGTANTLGNTATFTSGSVASSWVGLSITINGAPHIVATVDTGSNSLTTWDTLGTYTGVSYGIGPVVSWVSGGNFMQSWANKTITINSSPYTVTSDYPPDISPTALLLTSSAGNQSGVSYSINSTYPPACPANNPVLISSSQLSHIPQYTGGTVSTSGYTATLLSGTSFSSAWVGLTVTIDGSNYIIASVTSPSTLTTSTSLGTYASVAYTIGGVPPQSQASTACGGTCYFASIIGNTNSTPSITIEDGASGWYFAGIEATLGSGTAGVYPIVFMGEYSNAIAALPQYITFDRVLVDAPAGTLNEVTDGIDLNCVNCTVEYSNIWGIANSYVDSQAILINNSPGPILVAANHMEATGENMILLTECNQAGFYGWGILGCPIPSDITVRLNHFYKPLTWQSLPTGCVPSTGSGCYVVKDLFEIKMGQRVLLDSNILDTTFSGGQNEAIIVNCGGGTTPIIPSTFVCQDFTATNNLIEHAPVAGIFAGYGAANPAYPLPINAAPGSSTADRMFFRNNLGIDIDSGNPDPARGTFSYATGYGSGTGFAWNINQTQNLSLDHNTIINTPFGHDSANGVNGTGLEIEDTNSSTEINFQYTNSFHYASPNGGGTWPGNSVQNFTSATWGGDVWVGDYWNCINSGCGGSPPYPSGIIPVSGAFSPVNSTASPVAGYTACNVEGKPIGNVTTPGCWVLDWALVGLTDFTHCNDGTNIPGCALTSGSPYHNAGTDGLDVGANITALLSALSGVQ
jgi:YVTN family beta-propeller protein